MLTTVFRMHKLKKIAYHCPVRNLTPFRTIKRPAVGSGSFAPLRALGTRRALTDDTSRDLSASNAMSTMP